MQDAVIIVLRNGYGSTERLEENLQTVLFGGTPHLPGRSPKDVLAKCGWLAWTSLSQRPWLAALACLLLGSAVWAERLRRNKLASPVLVPSPLARNPGASK
jgi:hypothetical protein